MVDIHSHILHGIDDGPETLEDSLVMLETAARSGTTDIVGTPHANTAFTFKPDLVERKIAELRGANSSIRIHTGCDLHLTYDNIQDALSNPAKYTINHKQYLLVEFSNLVIFQGTDQVFDRMREAGMRPIITHPERNALLQQRLPKLEQWVRNGCLIQVTAQSFLGRFGRHARQFAETLVQRGLVHFVASDAHDVKDRTTRLDEAFADFADRFGRPLAEKVFTENPRAVIEGMHLDHLMEPPAARKWRLFSR